MPEQCRACAARPLAVCSPLSGAAAHRIAAATIHRDIAVGRPVVEEGDPAGFVMTLTQGCVMASLSLPDGRRQVLGLLDPGAVMGLAVDGRYVHTLIALEPSRVCFVPRPLIDAVALEEPVLALALRDRSIQELALAQQCMLMLGRKTARERVASAILWLSARAERLGRDPRLVKVPMARLDIADMLGLTVETTSRVFTALRKNGLIRLPRAEIVEIMDREGLTAEAGLEGTEL